MGAATVPILIGVTAGLGGAVLAKTMTSSKQSSMPTMPEMPSAPKPEKSIEKAEDATRRRKAALTQTIFTNPTGSAFSQTAGIARKVLLGS